MLFRNKQGIAARRALLPAVLGLAILLALALALSASAGSARAAGWTADEPAGGGLASPFVSPLPDDGGRNWDVRVHGVVTETNTISGTWTVAGRTVIITTSTWIKPKWTIPLSATLQVKGILQPDGTILATSIQWVHRVPDKAAKGTGQGVKPAGTPLGAPLPGVRQEPPGQGQGNGNGNDKPADHGKDTNKGGGNQKDDAGAGSGGNPGRGNGHK